MQRVALMPVASAMPRMRFATSMAAVRAGLRGFSFLYISFPPPFRHYRERLNIAAAAMNSHGAYCLSACDCRTVTAPRG